ncbi:MAG: hypothetical protein O3A10_10100 [Chloroflexi bacterium]|nr:hypothetical protein [Chloroflexota bacterium]MDA1146519.1 hypothetical protein [Chloroflexota bacterium]
MTNPKPRARTNENDGNRAKEPVITTARRGDALPRTQTDLVLDYLRTQGPLTQPEAQEQFGCLRLGARIWDLKQRGHSIRTDFVELLSGQRVARYALARHTTETTPPPETGPSPAAPEVNESTAAADQRNPRAVA